MSTFTPEEIDARRKEVDSWRAGPDGFIKWIEAVRPMIPGPRGKYIPFELEPFQEAAVRKLLATKRNGDFKYGTLCITWPRRHSKSTIAALLVLWRFCTLQNENIVILSNSEKQSQTVGYGLCKKIVANTRVLREQIETDGGSIQAFKMENPKLGNSLRTVAGNPSALYGEKLSCAWISELHAAVSDEGMQILSSSLGDTENSWLMVDSTTDTTGGPLHHLEQLAESGEDHTVCVSRVEYRDLAEALERSPFWIRRDWLKSRAVQLLPNVFASQHLNQRQGSESCLFSTADIAAAQERIPHPMSKADIEHIAAGRTYVTGGGLDRAFGFSKHGDKTIWTSVAKVAGNPGEEAHFYVLSQQDIFGSLGKLIKKSIQTDNDLYSFSNICIEAYNAQDIATWATDKGIPEETIHATDSAQIPAFVALYQVVSEGRLHFSAQIEDLVRELSTFQYRLERGKPKFGNDKFHDDRIYSLAWAIYSLRQQELSSFVLEHLVCNSRSAHANFCYLRGGDLVLNCSGTCQSHIQTLAMYNQYRHANIETEIDLQEFFQNLVSVSGVHIFA